MYDSYREFCALLANPENGFGHRIYIPIWNLLSTKTVIVCFGTLAKILLVKIDLKLFSRVCGRQDFPIGTLAILDIMIRIHKLLCYLCITAENWLRLASKTVFNFH